MAVTIVIGEGADEQRFAVAPYRLRELRLASPHIERMNELAKRISDAQEAGADPSMADMFDLSRALCEVLAIGISKVASEMTADIIEERTGFAALSGLQNAARALLEQSGLASEGKAPAPLESEVLAPAGPTPEALQPLSAE